MKLYDVDGHDQPLMLSDEHAELIGATEHAAEHADERPTRNALKSEWIDYAISQGGDPAVVESMTRVEIVEQYGG